MWIRRGKGEKEIRFARVPSTQHKIPRYLTFSCVLKAGPGDARPWLQQAEKEVEDIVLPSIGPRLSTLP